MKVGSNLEPSLLDRLRIARKLYAEGFQHKATPILDEILPKVLTAISLEVSADSYLSTYYAIKLMRKFSGVRSNLGGPVTSRRHMAQVLVLSHTRDKVLLQRRSPFKRQFPSTLSVSANAKIGPNGDIKAAVTEAMWAEVKISPDPRRLEVIGSARGLETHLTIASFYAFTPAENESLAQVGRLGQNRGEYDRDIVVHYNPQGRNLTVFSVNREVDRGKFREVLDALARQTEVEYIFGFSDTDQASFVSYQLTAQEEDDLAEEIKSRARKLHAARECLPRNISEASLEFLDSDEMCFIPWIQVRCESTTHPENFTTVLTGPYFPDSRIWKELGHSVPEIIGAINPFAEHSCLSGGKGANLAALQRLVPTDYRVPETSILTTLVYENLVTNHPVIGSLIRRLDIESNTGRASELARTIRERIQALELPHELALSIRSEFARLGGDVAVRSSATTEDMANHQAAGQATSYLHQITPESVMKGIKGVWASLFSDGFVAYRAGIGLPHRKARMAVLLQEFVRPKAAGVILSFDQRNHRPVYCISAQPGLGEGVVAGIGLADSWLVGSLCDYILQRSIQEKAIRFTPARQGGVMPEGIQMTEASLSDQCVLQLSRIAKQIHQHFKRLEIGEEISIEYVCDDLDRIVIVQARAKPTAIVRESHGKAVFRVRTVDTSRVPPHIQVIELSPASETAVPGAVVSTLQLDPLRSPKQCLPGRILVTHHTNNDYNGIFGSLDGLITTDGGQTSHASEHAFEKQMPCVVGSINALHLLLPHDGKQVTFDAGTRKLYLGSVPIIEEERELGVWLTDDRQIRGFADEGSRNEITRPWDISKRKRPKVFVEDPECRCRRRSNTYRYFQLDCFYRAWDRQAELLNELFGHRSSWILKPQARQVKVIEDKHQLVHIVSENDSASIYHFLLQAERFGLADIEMLFEARLDGFRRFARFTRSLTRIDATNVEQLLEELLLVFSWMHFGYWLDSVVEELAFQQLRYITNEGAFHKILRETAIAQLPNDYQIDPANPGLPRGKILDLSRRREKEIHALLESIISDSELRALFESPRGASDVLTELQTHFPQSYSILTTWSERYKLTREDLDVMSDSQEYVELLRKRLRERTAMSAEVLATFLEEYCESQGVPLKSTDCLRERDPSLFLVLRGFTRTLVAGRKGINPVHVEPADIETEFPESLRQLERAKQLQRPLQRVATAILNDYPELRRLLMVSRMQFPLREDAHHLIVPLQRILAKLMLEAAKPFVPGILPTPNIVFDLSLEEFVALFKEETPTYVAASSQRWESLRKAEKELQRAWTIQKCEVYALCGNELASARLWLDLTYENGGCGYLDDRGFIQDAFRALKSPNEMRLRPENESYRQAIFDLLRNHILGLEIALDAFNQATLAAVEILETQISASNLPRVTAYYRGERDRLRIRVVQLQRILTKACSPKTRTEPQTHEPL